VNEFDYHYLYIEEEPVEDDSGISYTHTPALKVLFKGLAPGKVGIEQIDFVVPENQAPGDWALFFNRGSCPDGTGRICDSSDAQKARSSLYVKLPVR
jgi:hypothetical protein